MHVEEQHRLPGGSYKKSAGTETVSVLTLSHQDLRYSLNCNQTQTDLKPSVYLPHKSFIQMTDLLPQPGLINGADLLQQDYRIFAEAEFLSLIHI